MTEIHTTPGVEDLVRWGRSVERNREYGAKRSKMVLTVEDARKLIDFR